jgi:thiol-disulfide isomerase/thioredoxin
MVDWDRVEELRSKGWDWDKIANDPKVAFHPDSSMGEPGRALRGLYHRQRSRQRRQGEAPKAVAPSKEDREKVERKWTLPRIGYLLVPVFGIWFALAYFIPSPVGLVLPAIPYLALGLVIVAFLLLFGLFRATGTRWSKVYRSTLVTGIILGLVISGVIALGGILFFGCPVLPSSGTSEPGQGWISVSASPWQDGGRPVVYFYGATWCPYCSASSWAIWKALTEFGTVSGAYTGYSYGPPEGLQYVPEMVLANANLVSSVVAFQVSEYVAGSDGTFPTTSNCYQQAYVTAYSGSSIPFVVVNGQYVHGGSSLIDPSNLQTWAGGANGGASAVQNAVASENTAAGSPWLQIQGQSWWLMAFIAKSTGATPANLALQPYYSGWSSATRSSVASDLAQIA